MTTRSNSATCDALRAHFEKIGYYLSKERTVSENGVDLIAKMGNEILAVEVIGYKKHGPARRKDFFEAIFCALSRIGSKDNPTKVGVAIASEAKIGFQARVNNLGESWSRFGKAFPEFHFWFVDFSTKKVEEIPWTTFKS